MQHTLLSNPHRRLNILTGEYILVSPHRMKRPWQGKVEVLPNEKRAEYDPTCYLCPGNKRSDGSENPVYTDTYVFTNDFSALLENTEQGRTEKESLLQAESAAGICKVICFSPNHNLTLPQMSVPDIEKVVDLWIKEYESLRSNKAIRYIQIFENKGEIMGCSNPHPHGQIWASDYVPVEVAKETQRQAAYFSQHGRSMLSDYLAEEIKFDERILVQNDHFVALVPFWAVWPYETMIISKRQVKHITDFREDEQLALAGILQQLTIRYDNLFEISFPYSAGMHQAPVNDGEAHDGWHWHMHFYPPLLRSATVKKFMVGYEMLANPQRDITPEQAALTLKQLPAQHYSAVKA